MQPIDRNSLAYWFPLLVPILMGLVLGFVKLQGDISNTAARSQQSAEIAALAQQSAEIAALAQQSAETAALAQQSAETEDLNTSFQNPVMNNLLIDFMEFLGRVSEGVALSIISLDIWVLTTLFAAGAGERSAMTARLYVYPITGILSHFLLLVLIVAIGNGAYATFHADFKVPLYLSPWALRLYGFCLMLSSVVLGWYIRRKIWFDFECFAGTEPTQNA